MPRTSPTPTARHAAAYLRVLATFARNSLVRDLSFRANFILQCLSSLGWALMNYGLYKIIYAHTTRIGSWHEAEFFVFLATIWIINSLIQAFFMPNAEEFSELIRTGQLDFALLKPIDTQFLVSFARFEWSQLTNFFLGLLVLGASLAELAAQSHRPLTLHAGSIAAYLFFVSCGVVILYGLMFTLAATSIWLGRNQNLYTFWFYITNFYRYPMEIYQRGRLGWTLYGTFTFVVPILVVANVPARWLAQPLRPEWGSFEWLLAGISLAAAGVSLWVSRVVFRWALASYRSASS